MFNEIKKNYDGIDFFLCLCLLADWTTNCLLCAHTDQGSKGEHEPHQQPPVQEKVFSDEELVSLIDPILQMDDTSRDGFIDYPEFVQAQQKAAAAPQQQQHQPQQQPAP